MQDKFALSGICGTGKCTTGKYWGTIYVIGNLAPGKQAGCEFNMFNHQRDFVLASTLWRSKATAYGCLLCVCMLQNSGEM